MDVEDEDEMKTGRRNHLLEMLERAKKETTHYKTAYEGVTRKKEAKLKEKEKIMVIKVYFLISPQFVSLLYSCRPSLNSA